MSAMNSMHIQQKSYNWKMWQTFGSS